VCASDHRGPPTILVSTEVHIFFIDGARPMRRLNLGQRRPEPHGRGVYERLTSRQVGSGGQRLGKSCSEKSPPERLGPPRDERVVCNPLRRRRTDGPV